MCAEPAQRKSSRKKAIRHSHKRRPKPPRRVMAGLFVDPESDEDGDDADSVASDSVVASRARARNRKPKPAAKSRVVLYGAGMTSPLLQVPSPSGTGVLSFTDEDTNTDEPHGHWRYDGPQNPNETSDDAGFSPMTDDRSQGDVENSRSGEDASSEHEDSGELETKSLED
jgi:hypothetical protein